jgi:hypothetical protein
MAGLDDAGRGVRLSGAARGERIQLWPYIPLDPESPGAPTEVEDAGC